jgi:hypothetical protein
MVYEKLDQKLELAIHRNDDLNKTLITISSWVIGIVIPILYTNNPTMGCYEKITLLLTTVTFLFSILLILISWNKALQVDDKWIEYLKNMCDVIQWCWYDKSKESELHSKLNSTKLVFNNEIIAQEPTIRKIQKYWYILFYFWILFISITSTLIIFSN